jgi:type II secretory pathway component HofQ
LIKPTLPADADYTPILKSRQGGNGSWVILGDYGDNREANKNDVLTRLTNMVNSGERTIEDFKKMSYVINHEVDEVTGAVSITSAKLSVRYYISPARRTDGAEDISQQES